MMKRFSFFLTKELKRNASRGDGRRKKNIEKNSKKTLLINDEVHSLWERGRLKNISFSCYREGSFSQGFPDRFPFSTSVCLLL